MERITFEGNFCDIAKCTSAYIERCACSPRKVWERLKAYEDTGLAPEEIAGQQTLQKELVRYKEMYQMAAAERDANMKRLIELERQVGE